MVMSGRGGYGVAMEEGSSYLGFDTNNLRNWHNWTTTKVGNFCPKFTIYVNQPLNPYLYI